MYLTIIMLPCLHFVMVSLFSECISRKVHLKTSKTKISKHSTDQPKWLTSAKFSQASGEIPCVFITIYKFRRIPPTRPNILSYFTCKMGNTYYRMKHLENWNNSAQYDAPKIQFCSDPVFFVNARGFQLFSLFNLIGFKYIRDKTSDGNLTHWGSKKRAWCLLLVGTLIIK